ncbi:NAD(P)-binding domain-containing protein, partial [Escherichia coli]|uniref:NAD(P)-binding domain-containing protein n=3 Tax=Escherichia coli TaxID=562 RepID=UPI0020234FB3
MKLGFIGLGIMGTPMAINLARAGHQLHVTTIGPVADELLSLGAVSVETARQVLMNPLMILVKIIKLRWIHILSYDQMVSRKINNQTTRCANS